MCYRIKRWALRKQRIELTACLLRLLELQAHICRRYPRLDTAADGVRSVKEGGCTINGTLRIRRLSHLGQAIGEIRHL